MLRLICPARITQKVVTNSKYVIGGRWSRAAHTNVVDELEARGFVAAMTSPKLRTHTLTPTTIYAGVDPSAPSLHVGNLLPLLGLLHFAAKGHKSLALIGGATGSIGDPSGRSTERVALDEVHLNENVKGITAQVERFFERGLAYAAKRKFGYGPVGALTDDGSERSISSAEAQDRDLAQEQKQQQQEEKKMKQQIGSVQVLNNLEWTKELGLLEFLRTVGKVARVNIMMSRDSVKNRLDSESGISYTEFSYQLLQGYDFYHLHKDHHCRIQLGGSDQWGNIVAGIDLVKSLRPVPPTTQNTSNQSGNMIKTTKPSRAKSAGSEATTSSPGESIEAYGLTIPLMTTSSGEKFGKSAGNAVWLDERRTSISDFYQFFFRTPDSDVGKYLKTFTLLPLSEIEAILAEHAAQPRLRRAQRLLAEEITELVHGDGAVLRSRAVASLLFHTEPRKLKVAEVLAAFEGNDTLKRVLWKDIKGVPISKLCVVYGLVKARNDANRLISSKALYINDRRINDPRSEIARGDLVDGHLAVLKFGKNSVVLHIDEIPPMTQGMAKKTSSSSSP